MKHDILRYKDIKNYRPLVKKGGVLGGHDYDSNIYPGVKLAVDRMVENAKIEGDLVWWVTC